MSARTFDLSKAKKYGNITVEHGIGRITVKLHQNVIAERIGDSLRISHCGWITNTSRVAINNSLSQLGREERVFISKGSMYLSNYLKDTDKALNITSLLNVTLN